MVLKNFGGTVIDVDECEWCYETYPSSAKEIFYHVSVFGKDHIICGDCYNQLKEVHPSIK